MVRGNPSSTSEKSSVEYRMYWSPANRYVLPSASRTAVSIWTGSAKLFLILPQGRVVGAHGEPPESFRKDRARPARSHPISHSAPVASTNAALTPAREASPVDRTVSG